jgi:hypothetical protein
MPQGAEDTAGLGPGEIHQRSVESYAQVLEGRLEDALKLIDPRSSTTGEAPRAITVDATPGNRSGSR